MDSDDEVAPIRVLCLHGKGTNSAIFSTMMRPLMRKLGNRVEFHFLDGKVACTPYHGIQQFFPEGPYFAWYDAPTPDRLEDAYTYVLTYILSRGPKYFDGIIGFSQGAAIAATLALRHQDLLFRFACFFCGGRPFDPATSLRFEHMGNVKFTPSPFDLTKELDTGKIIVKKGSLVNDGVVRSSSIKRKGASPIRIPTLHLIGLRDSARVEGSKLMQLCDPKSSETLEYDGGHCLPRKSIDVNRLADLFFKTADIRAL